MKRWILSYDRQGFKQTKKFTSTEAMFAFIMQLDLPRFKAKWA